MPRDVSGNYTLPIGNPVIDGTIIDVDWANPTMSDIAVQLNNVVTRDGILPMTVPFKLVNGAVGAPALSFISAPTTGLYLDASGMYVSYAGVKRLSFLAAGVTTLVGTLNATAFAGPLTGNVTGDLTGNVTGNLTGNVTGDLTGDVTGDLTGNVTGNLTGTVTGHSTLDLPLTGGTLSGNLGIGVSPTAPLHITGAGELIRLLTTSARGSGNNTLAFYDPTGRKGYVGYGSTSTDNFYFSTDLVGSFIFQSAGTERLTLSSAGLLTNQDGIEFGFRSIPLIGTGDIVIAKSFGGKGLLTTGNITVTTGVCDAGDIVTVVTTTASVVIVQGAGATLHLAGTLTTGNRTVAARSVATILFISSTTAYVSGPGVS